MGGAITGGGGPRARCGHVPVNQSEVSAAAPPFAQSLFLHLILHLFPAKTCDRINSMTRDDAIASPKRNPNTGGRGARRLNMRLVAVGAGWILLLEFVLMAYRLGWLRAGWPHLVGYAVGVNFTPWVWCGYLLVLSGVLGLLSGMAWILVFRYRVLALWLWSVPAWCYFDWLNFRFMRNAATGLHAWEYQGLPASTAVRCVGYFLAFAAIAPGLLLTAEIWRYSAVGRVKSGGVRISRGIEILSLVLGAGFFAAPFVLHDPIANLMIWVSLIFMLDPVNTWCGRPSLIADWRAGRWGRTLCLMLAGLCCGLLWEFWNYWAVAKWTYHLPFLGSWSRFHYFAMPLPGLAGYLGFGPEIWVMWQFSLLLLGPLVEAESPRPNADGSWRDSGCL